MTKGRRRERQAERCYSEAGWRTYRPERAQYGDNDVFGLFDLMAFDPALSGHHDPELRLVQVKANKARGVEAWCDKAREFDRLPGVRTEFVVCHDRTGWRVIRPEPDTFGHEVVYDGRYTLDGMNEGLIEFLQNGDDDSQ